VKKQQFGEGEERLAYQFFEIAGIEKLLLVIYLQQKKIDFLRKRERIIKLVIGKTMINLQDNSVHFSTVLNKLQ
jgi:hypothetical protein